MILLLTIFFYRYQLTIDPSMTKRSRRSYRRWRNASRKGLLLPNSSMEVAEGITAPTATLGRILVIIKWVNVFKNTLTKTGLLLFILMCVMCVFLQQVTSQDHHTQTYNSHHHHSSHHHGGKNQHTITINDTPSPAVSVITISDSEDEGLPGKKKVSLIIKC